VATYLNNLRLKEITTGDEDGVWGTSTNTNLELVTDGFSYGTKDMAADANETFTMPDATADATRGFYLKITSAVSLTATREVTLGPDTVSKVWLIENATSGSQIITIKQGSGATINVASGSKVMLVTDGLGAGAAVINANPTEVGGSVTSVDVSGGTTGLTTSGGPVTGSGTITLAGTLAVANGGTGATSLTANNVILGNGTSAVQAVAPGTSGNVLTSTGTAWTSSAPAAGGITYTTTKTANYTAVANDGVLTNTTAGAFTVTLPASPANGDQIIVADAGGTWGTNNLTVGRNGNNIADVAQDLVLDISGASVQFVYNTSGTATWEVFAQIGGNGGTVVTLDGTQTLTNKTLTAPTITGMTLAGAVTGADQTVSAINLKDYGEVTNAIGSTGGGTQDIDLTLGNYVTATVDTSANTFTFSNPTASDEGCGFTLVLTNGGSQTVNWPASVDWPAATAPTLTAAGVDKLVFETSDGGTTWLGNLAGAAYA